MTLPTKTQSVAGLMIFIVGLGTGRYSYHQVTITQVQTVSDTQKEQDKVTDKKTTIVKEPTGKTVTTITEETRTVDTQDTKVKSQDMVKTSPQWQVSALAGIDIRTGIPAYGASLSRQFVGPITIGAFGLTNGTVGVSIGMTF